MPGYPAGEARDVHVSVALSVGPGLRYLARVDYGTRLMDGDDPSTERYDTPLRVLVADDDPIARRAIKRALSQPGIIVIAEAHDGREAVELCMHYRPDVVLMDVVMPVLDGIAATKRIVQELPDQVVVILTSSDEQDFGFIGLRAGAAGFLSKDIDIDALPQAICGAQSGEAVISRRLGMKLIEHLRRAPEGATGMRPVKSPLTPREWEIIDLLVESMTTDEIAETLVLSTETVRSHVKNILRKLDVRSREEAVEAAQAMRSGLPRPT
jgi:NarL family two-component system response regulator LiaR